MKAHVDEAARREAIRPVAQTIRVFARARGVTMLELATALGVSEQSFYDKLRGKGPLGLEELIKIANRLEVSAPDLLEPIEMRGWAARDSNPEPTEHGLVAALSTTVAQRTDRRSSSAVAA